MPISHAARPAVSAGARSGGTRRPARRGIRAVLLAGLVLLAPAARADEADIAEEIVGYFAAPRTEDLARVAEDQRDLWRGFCAAPDKARFDGVRGAFRRTVEAWAAVEIVRFGPMTEQSRHERMNFQPERRNVTGRAVAALLAGTGTADLEAVVARGSVAGQGLGALERILYDPGAETLLVRSPAGERRCAVGAAIAARIAATAREAALGWDAGLAAAGGSPHEVMVRALTDLIGDYRDLLENRVKPVIGDGPATAKPEIALFRRSGLSERMLVVNLASAQALAGLLATGNPAAGRVLAHAAAATETAERLSGPLGTLAADPARRPEALRVFAAVRDAHNRIGAELPEALGISIGFNSLDGD